VYLTPNAPNCSYVFPEKYARMYQGQKLKENAVAYYGMITNIDDNVGTLLAKLKEWDLERNTLVIFMTDNGHPLAGLYNAGMRAAKGSPYQGGTRVPAFWRWPGVLKPGVDIDKLAAHIDLYPTLVEIAGAKVPAGVRLDGRSLLPLLQDAKAEWPDRYLFTHVGRWPQGKAAESKHDKCAVRTNRYRF